MNSPFSERLLDWFDEHGRKHLPWQQPRTPYRVWISEIMLQQTQVATVIDYFERFMANYPDVTALASANLDSVLHHWTGLGYYARARNLHKAAARLVEDYGGTLPADLDALIALPGIGRSTAGAILAMGFERRALILDGNVKRVLSRHGAIAGYPGRSKVERMLWQRAEELTPRQRCGDYTQAIMDLGASLCSRARPNCETCPVSTDCTALSQDRVSEFPHSRPHKTKPARSVRMYLTRNPAGEVLLEQRPPQGIWGGLWNPPERGVDYRDEDFLQEYGLPNSAQSRTGTAFRHSFTHYHLDITPVFITLSEPVPSLVAEGAAALWYQPLAPQQQLGLSAVAVKLIATTTSTVELQSPS